MDFELKHLDMIQNETQNKAQVANQDYAPRHQTHTERIHSSSQVLQELSEQLEDLQNKLNVNYKKLLLYETENQKLIQEKNALFFENKMFSEHNSILADKNKKLLAYSEELETDLEKASHRIEISEKLITTQKTDLNRLTKFHLKIKNIVKPFIEKIKSENSELTATLNIKENLLNQKDSYIADLLNKNEDLTMTIEALKQNYENERKAITQSYEEQIHFLSKEIVEQQQKTLDAQNETLRLKKQCETKLFVENELIKYKRAQDEHIQTINNLKLKESELARQLTSLQISDSELKQQLTDRVAEVENQQIVLDATRKQLTAKINEIEQMHLRLKMLEKLNSSLSLSLKDSQS